MICFTTGRERRGERRCQFADSDLQVLAASQ
jgi:hypothetical protein